MVKAKKHKELMGYLKKFDPKDVDEKLKNFNLDDNRKITGHIFRRLCESTTTSGMINGDVPITALFAIFLERPKLLTPIQVTSQLPKALIKGDMLTAHCCRLYLRTPNVFTQKPKYPVLPMKNLQ